MNENKDYKITIRLSKREYDILNNLSHKLFKKPNLSKLIRLILQPYFKEN